MLFFSWYAPIYAPFWWRDYAPNAFLCYHIMLVFGGNTSPMLNKVIKWEFYRVFSHSCSLYILLDHFLGVAAKAINTRKKCGKQSTNSGERTIPRRKILPHVGRGTYTCTYVHSFPRLETLGFPILRQSRVVAHQYTPCPPPKTSTYIICGQQTSLHESEYGVPTASGAISRTAVSLSYVCVVISRITDSTRRHIIPSRTGITLIVEQCMLNMEQCMLVAQANMLLFSEICSRNAFF